MIRIPTPKETGRTDIAEKGKRVRVHFNIPPSENPPKRTDGIESGSIESPGVMDDGANPPKRVEASNLNAAFLATAREAGLGESLGGLWGASIGYHMEIRKERGNPIWDSEISYHSFPLGLVEHTLARVEKSFSMKPEGGSGSFRALISQVAWWVYHSFPAEKLRRIAKGRKARKARAVSKPRGKYVDANGKWRNEKGAFCKPPKSKTKRIEQLRKGGFLPAGWEPF